MAVLAVPVVWADVEPNNTPETAEDPDGIMFMGYVSENDTYDYYRIEVLKNYGLTVSVDVPDNNNSITVQSCDSSGSPDGRIEVYLTKGEWIDEDDWHNKGHSNSIIFLRVSGHGAYGIQLSGGELATEEEICGSVILLLLSPLVFLIITLIFLKRNREK
jgi:hypothetical protein